MFDGKFDYSKLTRAPKLPTVFFFQIIDKRKIREKHGWKI